MAPSDDGIHTLEHCEDDSIDILKVIKMLLIHDLVEIYDGDTFLYDEKLRQQAVKKERLALVKLTAILPDNQAKELIDLWEEFELGQSMETRYAVSLDALQPVLNHVLTAPANYNPYKIVSSKGAGEKANHKEQILPNSGM